MPAADTIVPNFRTSEPDWYNNGVWGDFGYAVPNVGDDPRTLNEGIQELVDATGRNLAAMMQTSDVDQRRPPRINTLLKVHHLVVRARLIVATRSVDSKTPQFEGVHNNPAPQDQILYPVPYFRVRNRWMKSWCKLVMGGLTELIQSPENRNTMDFSTALGGLFGQYLDRIYTRMAIEFFLVDPAKAKVPGFVIEDAILGNYDEAKVWTSTDLIDTTPPTFDVPSAVDLRVLTDGIPATKIVGVQKWPGGALPTQAVTDDSAFNAGEAGPTAGAGAGAGLGPTAAGAGAGVAFPPPPKP